MSLRSRRFPWLPPSWWTQADHTNGHTGQSNKVLALVITFLSLCLSAYNNKYSQLVLQNTILAKLSRALGVHLHTHARLLPSSPLRKQQNLKTTKLQLQTSTRHWSHKQKTTWVTSSFGFQEERRKLHPENQISVEHSSASSVAEYIDG